MNNYCPYSLQFKSNDFISTKRNSNNAYITYEMQGNKDFIT